VSGAALSSAYLSARLGVVEARVSATVALRRQARAGEDERFRGLYLSERDVDRLLAGETGPPLVELDEASREFVARVEAALDGSDEQPRLRTLQQRLGLSDLEVEVLLVALAPDVDPRFERLYAYLHDDVSRRRASVGLALEVAGAGFDDASARAALVEGATLLRFGLVEVLEPDRPALSRSLRVPERVVSHLLGGDAVDPAVASVLAHVEPVDLASSAGLAAALAGGARLAYVRATAGDAGMAVAAAAAHRLGNPVLPVDLRRLSRATDPALVVTACLREAALCGAVLVAGPLDALEELGPERVWAVTELPWPAVLIGSSSWNREWSRQVPYLADAPALTSAERAGVWRHRVDGLAAPGLDAGAATEQFRLTPEQIAGAVETARLRVLAEQRPVEAADLHAGARAQNSAGLERLARRLVPRVRWDELVLPPVAARDLRELAARARHRELVLDDWAMGSGARRRGIIALFAGPPGTGKTMAAEVVAADLGLDLYVINLATVVDKYIGETEKNLERLFSEAEGVNCVLFFDEADALFGKRSEVKDARDRYANVEIAYLLQRMERFDGTAILATNLRANVDEAFARRLDVAIDFQVPEAEHRRVLWEHSLRPEVPRSDDIDLDFLARSFELSGGNITNIAVTAAFLAAEDARPVTMGDLIQGTEREYRKLGRMCVRSEFGPYHDLLEVAS